MSDPIRRKIEIVGTSPRSLTDAIENGISRASKTVRHLEWFEVGEISGHITDGKVSQYQVTMKVGFRIED